MNDFFTPFDDDPTTGVRGVAAQLNLRYIDTVRDRSYRVEVPGGIPELPLFTDVDTAQNVSDLAYGTFAGYPLQVFTFDTVAYRDEPDQTKRSCVVFDVPFRFPNIQIAPHNRLSAARQGRVDPGSFEGRYRVITHDVESADVLLDDGMRSWLAGIDPLIRLELSQRSVLGHVGLVAPEALPALVTTVFTFVIRVPDAAARRFGGGV